MNKSHEAYIIDGVRTAVGRFRGGLSAVRADDMGSHVILHLTNRYSQIPLADYDDVIMGCANQAGDDNRNVARMSLLLAGLPVSVPGETVNRLCASSMSAVIQAKRAICADDGQLFISGGVENMTRGPFVMEKSSKAYGGNNHLYDSSFGWRFINEKMDTMYGTDSMGMTAENLAEQYQISREAQDQFALRSHRKAAHAQKNGRFKQEIVPLSIPQRKSDPICFEKDEFIRHDANLMAMAKLRPAFKSLADGGTVTAGNASGLNDGAVALLIAGGWAVEKYELQPIAKIVASAVAGVEPRIMGIGPVKASLKALKKARLTLADMDIIEINEAFAAQVIACLRELGVSETDERVNPNGGAIALGHPLGMSGGRILLTAALELKLSKKKYALVTMCVGVGQGYATIIENIAR